MPPMTIPHASLIAIRHKPRATTRKTGVILKPNWIGGTKMSVAELVSLTPRMIQTKMTNPLQTEWQKTGLNAFTLIFDWPGYEMYEFLATIPIAGEYDSSIIRAVGIAYGDFHQKAARAVGVDPTYAIRPNSAYANLDRLFLRSINHVEHDVFVVEVESL